jgi:ATP-binding cassette subfamily B protein AbcA/BmrA
MQQGVEQPSKQPSKQPTKQDMNQFFRLIWSTKISKSLLAFGLFGSILTTFTQLLIPFATQQFIDGIELDFFTPTMIAMIIGVFILQVVFNGLSTYILGKIGQRVVARLREFMWNKIINLPVRFFDYHASGEVVSRITNDTMIVQNLISQFFPQFVNGIITIIGVFFILFFMDWQMTLVMMLAVPLAFAFMLPLGKKMASVSRELQDETAFFSGNIQQTISEIRLMKSSTAEPFEKKKGKNGVEKLYRIGLKEAKVIALIGPLMYVLMMGVMVLVIGYGGVRVAQGSMTTGALVAFLLYLFQIIFPVTSFMNFFAQLKKAAGATERIATILDEEEEEREQGIEKDISNLPIVFENVSFGYEKETPVIKNISFETRPGEKIAFAGPSGGGKTTLFALIERFYQPTEGKIKVGETSIQELSMHSWREQIGYVSQENAMMSGTIRDNLCYGLPSERKVSDEELWKVTEMAYAKDFIQSFPDGLNERIGERGTKLSGGQRQRINIARAFLRDPKILMMDEATASLDSQSEKVVSQALSKLMQGRTTFVIAHRLSTITDADKIVFIEKGQMTGIGTHDDLIQTHDLYQLFAEQQLN